MAAWSIQTNKQIWRVKNEFLLVLLHTVFSCLVFFYVKNIDSGYMSLVITADSCILSPTWFLTLDLLVQTVCLATSPQTPLVHMLSEVRAAHQRNKEKLWIRTGPSAGLQRCRWSLEPKVRIQRNTTITKAWKNSQSTQAPSYLVYELSDPDNFVDHLGQVSANKRPRLFSRDSMATTLKVCLYA